MRLHTSWEDDLDQRVGPRDRSRFIGHAVRRALDEAKRADALEAALGSIPDTGHEFARSGSAASTWRPIPTSCAE